MTEKANDPILKTKVGNANNINEASMSETVVPITVDVFDDLNPSNSYSENDGSTNWTGSWTEVGDDNIATTGTINITSNRLYLNPSSTSASVYRAIDMTHITSATLNYNYLRDASAGIFRVQISTDLSNWTTLRSYSGAASGITPDNVGLDPHLPVSGLLYLRFLREAGSTGGGQSFDDISITGSGNTTEINCSNNIDDDGDGLLDCADSDCYPITLSNLSISSCINHPLQDVNTLSVEVSWACAPPSDIIEVNIVGKTEYIDVAGGASSPIVTTFNVPADGMTSEIVAQWRDAANTYSDTIGYTATSACSTDTIACSILYLCGQTKPADGDAWDHGIMNYFDQVNGSSSMTARLAKPDASGTGIYDPDNPTTLLPVNFSDYSLIFISSTTEGQLASDLIDSLKTFAGSILNNNYLIIDDLGMSAIAGAYSFQQTAYTDNTTQAQIYNYNNLNSVFAPLFTEGDYLASADAYLWIGSGDQAAGIDGITFHYTQSDVLPGIATHGSRTYLGYHMNGVYENPVNGGATPAPVSSWFSPSKHLTLEGKVYFDQAILAATTACNEEICNNNTDDDGDGLTDCADSECCCANAPALSKS